MPNICRTISWSVQCSPSIQRGDSTNSDWKGKVPESHPYEVVSLWEILQGPTGPGLLLTWHGDDAWHLLWQPSLSPIHHFLSICPRRKTCYELVIGPCLAKNTIKWCDSINWLQVGFGWDRSLFISAEDTSRCDSIHITSLISTLMLLRSPD